MKGNIRALALGVGVSLLLCLPLQSQTSSSGSDTQQPATSSAPDSSVPQAAAQDTSKDQDKDLKKSHKYHVRLDGVTVGAGYTHFSGPAFGPFWGYGFYPYGFYSPFFFNPLYGPFYYPGYFSGFGYAADKGEVKLSSDPKSAEVYLDGAYAGTVEHLKNIWLDPGAYDLSIEARDRAPYRQRIYVLSGKSLKIKARLQAQAAQPDKEEKR